PRPTPHGCPGRGRGRPRGSRLEYTRPAPGADPAMLELRRLLLAPWQPAAPGAAWLRECAVRDGAGGRVVGFAREPRPPPWWRRWLPRAVLAVYEAPDDSLLFTVVRGWAL